MGKSVLVIGPSGSGKSTAIRNLNPQKTNVISALGKGLPFKGSGKNYTKFNKETGEGNLFVTSSTQAIIKIIKWINTERKMVTTVIVDDSTFLPAKELDRRRGEQGYNKFNDIAHDFLEISELANNLRPDLNIYFLHHTKTDGDGVLEEKKVRAQSFGKMIDEKLASIEAQFEIVLLSEKIVEQDGKTISYRFKTRDANSTAKSPMGMFEDEYIDNDLNLVNNTIACYYEDDCKEEKVEVVIKKK